MWFDSHFHGDFAEIDSQQTSPDISGFLVPAADPQHWQRVIHYATKHQQPYALGVHPWWVDAQWRDWLTSLPVGCNAIGETGLDALKGDFALQIESFKAHIELAQARDLPVIAHCVRAVPELIEVISQYPNCRGVVHAFNGNVNQARQLIEMGWYIGIGGLVTYPNNKRLREVVKQLKGEGMLLETDAPSLKPYNWPLEHNQAKALLVVADEVCDISGVTPQVLSQTLNNNLANLFNL
ncbi:TatD family hydrolase [Salinibius halmophilus]|uniref:TatD family hydrolase n=1 Tax=Salinibius halmophilus TaxID=1853216 RepID=UPI000E671274|nr:TatD family hydrolase [Salinibius halmophilus]